MVVIIRATQMILIIINFKLDKNLKFYITYKQKIYTNLLWLKKY